MSEFLHAGFDHFVRVESIIAFGPITSAPMLRLVQQEKEAENVLDFTHGRRTKTVIITTGPVVLSALGSLPLVSRLDQK